MSTVEVQSKNILNGFIGGSTGNRYPNMTGEMLVNASVVPTPTGRSPNSLVPRLGYTLKHALTNIKYAYYSPVLEASLILTSTGTLYYSFDNSTFTSLGSVDIDDDRAYATDTFDKVVFTSGGSGYVISKSTSVLGISSCSMAKVGVDANGNEITTGWTKPSSISFVDGYVIWTERGTRGFYRSELNGTAFTDTLNFSYTMGAAGNLVNLAVINREVYLFAERHTELWWNSGAEADQPFTRQDGRVFYVGCKSVNTLVCDSVGYNVGISDSRVAVFSWSGQPNIISPDMVDADMAEAEEIYITTSVENNCRFIHFILDKKSVWSYDVRSSTWHKRVNQLPIDFFRMGNDWYLADKAGIHLVGGSTDNGAVITSSRTSSHIIDRNLLVFHTLLEFDFAGEISDLLLEYSDDGGKTWKNFNPRRTAVVGQYNRYRFDRLGKSRDRVYKLRWSGAPLHNVYLDAETGAK